MNGRWLRLVLCGVSLSTFSWTTTPFVTRVYSRWREQNATAKLQESVGQGDTIAAHWALKAGANPDGATPSGERGEGTPPVCRAAIAGQGRMALVLLQGGANPNIACGDLTGDGKTDTTLSAAAATGDLVLVRRLLQRGANVNDDPDRLGESLSLQVAAWRGQGEIVQELLAHGANPLTHDTRGVLLALAVRAAGWVEIADAIDGVAKPPGVVRAVVNP